MAAPRSLNKNNSGETTKWNRFSIPNHGPGHHHPAVKRIMQEARELANDPSTEYSAAPLEVRATPSPRLSYPYPCACSPFHFTSARAALGRHFCMYFLITLCRGDVSNCSCSIYVDLRSGIAPCAGLRAQISRGDCIISGSGYLRNIHSVHQVSWSSPPTADLN
jgi:hypothetical protein